MPQDTAPRAAEHTSPHTAQTPDSPKASLTAQDAKLQSVHQLWHGAVCAQPAEAVQRLNAFLQESPDNPQALALRGMARSQLGGQREEAFEDLTAAVLRAPTARHYAWRGLASLRGGNFRAAESDARYALRKDPKDAVAHMVLGLVAQEQGKNQDACAALRTACQGGECSGLESAQEHNICPR